MRFFFSREERLRYLGFDDRWALLLGVPLLSGIAFLLFTANDQAITNEKVVICVLVGTLHTLIYWLINRAMLMRTRRAFPGQHQITQRILALLASILLSVVIVEAFFSLVLDPLFPIITEVGYGDSSVLFQVSVSMTLCVLVLSIYESIYFFTKYRHSLVEQERLSRAHMQAQLSALKEQVNPHFLFNSLNTLTNLIPEDTEKATLFTQRLAAVYRRILEHRHEELIPLEEEVTALRDYIFLMQTRFEEKLHVEWHPGAGTQVPGKCWEGKRIVPLSLQLLVENAIKHNVVSQAAPLRIRITVTEEDITVTNSLNLRSRPQASTGWGQDNIRQRYRMVTDRPIEIECTDTQYRVTLPLLTDTTAASHVAA